MKISYNWLKEYISITQTPAELGDILTNIGLEVEGIENFESVRGGLRGCFIGRVNTCEKHPDADKLSITSVDIGGDKDLDIICGAPNVRAGQKVVVATVGTTLYKGDESLTLKKVKIRGEISEGMICAEDEIGLGSRHDGIMVLDKDAVVGTPASEYFDIRSDTVFEIGLTPNRIDGASHYGVARDLAAFLKLKAAVKLTKPTAGDFQIDNHDLPVEVRIENEKACNRYAGITLTGVNVSESPDWLKTKLLSVGLNPINNVVDITNYVLYELGQPLHAFDADQIAGHTVVVKTMDEGTKFVTLDEVERSLSADDLMICNAKEGMCIAGVFGGVHSGVSGKTKNIFLESAYFDPIYVRRTSKRHGLNTDASFRFERGADPEMTVPALKRAALLIREIAGGKISSEIVDEYPRVLEPFRVKVKYSHVDRLVGKKIERDTIKRILEALEISLESESKDAIEVIVPAYRVDVRREADVIEEILRIYGYNNVGLKSTLTSVLTYTEKPDKEKVTQIISDYLSANGFNEIMCNSLTRQAYYEGDPAVVELFNPLSSDLNRMRTTLLYGGLETIIYNINRKRNNLRLFEIGNCYHINPKADPDGLSAYGENERLALFITGPRHEGNWIEKEKPGTFYELKSHVEGIMGRLGLDKNLLIDQDVESPHFTDGITISAEGMKLAELGILEASLTEQFDIPSVVYFADIRWSEMLEAMKGYQITMTEIPKYPPVRRDLSMIIDKTIPFSRIKEIATRTGKMIKSVTLFDVYESEKLERGKKSYAVGFVLQDESKTLTDKEIDKIMNKIQKNLEKDIGARIRQAV
ncbi:MAG: phenylalanine--tRNA ligase subunit beta [Bacteroidales bacterium]|nr:phenylalanine--tRNA ligase subunit beta [Bacteroidales bacterium]